MAKSSSMSKLKWLYSREVGGQNRNCMMKSHSASGSAPSSYKSSLLPGLYGSVREIFSWKPSETVKHTHHGGIFNFDFSTDGSVLATACERKSILLFDPFNGKLIGYKEQAHQDCVNYVRFLDTRVFATCSDDTTICLWDLRYMKKNFRVLRGHSNWVKNIEYDASSGLLVTSGFDGSIYTWDINNYSTSETYCQNVFHTSGLMRSKLSPDGTKLIMSTAGGYLVIIHNLNLRTLGADLHGFKPNMYRLMQMSQSPVRQGYTYNHVFERKPNRVEFVSDFPENNDAEVIASLQIHPYGWCALSRNTSADENSEWTCVHDIQAMSNEDNEQSVELDDEDSVVSNPAFTLPDSRSSSPSFFLNASVEDDSSSSRSQSPRLGSRHSSPGFAHDTYTRARRRRATDSDSSNDGVSDSNNQERAALDRSHDDEITEATGGSDTDPDAGTSSIGASTSGDNVTFLIRSDSRVPERTLLLMGQHELLSGMKPKIHENKPRLLYHVEEPNVGRGFIKELCFSNDGRLVCSPFAYGTRLLAFDEKCHELCDAIPDGPKQLTEVGMCMSHRNVVVTTKFSPVHCMFVSGCLDGNVSFHQPVL